MVAASPDDDRLKEALKAALVEVVEERGDLPRDVIAEVMGDIAMARAIQEAEIAEEEAVSREEVFRHLDSRR
jgi:DNA-binding phage protein